jgi:hypothetical protein
VKRTWTASPVEGRRTRLHYLKGSIRGEGGRPIEVGGSDDHVHVLTHLRADRALSEVLNKKRSFQEDLEQLFEKHGIKPDPRFWER